MITDIQIDTLKILLGNEKGYEICCNHNLRIRGHVGFDEFENLMEYCKRQNICYTLGADGVLVVHD